MFTSDVTVEREGRGEKGVMVMGGGREEGRSVYLRRIFLSCIFLFFYFFLLLFRPLSYSYSYSSYFGKVVVVGGGGGGVVVVVNRASDVDGDDNDDNR